MTDETFERVARTYGDMLYRVAYHALKNRADAEDVTQTVLLKLYQQGDRFESEEHRKHWLLRVAVNESRRLLRSFWRSRAGGAGCRRPIRPVGGERQRCKQPGTSGGNFLVHSLLGSGE